MDIQLKKPLSGYYYGARHGPRGAHKSRLQRSELTDLYAEEIYEDIFSDDVPDDWFEFPEEDNTPYQYQDPFEFSSELEVRAGYKMLTGKEPTTPEQYIFYNRHIREVNEYIVEQCRIKKYREERRLQEKKEQQELYNAICEEFDKRLTEDMDNLLLRLEMNDG